MRAHESLGTGEVGLGNEDEDFVALGVYAELQTGEVVGAGEGVLVGLDLERDAVLIQQFGEAGGLGGVVSAELVKEGFVVGHGRTMERSAESANSVTLVE